MKITTFSLLTSVIIFSSCHAADLKQESDAKRTLGFFERFAPKNDADELRKTIKIWQEATADHEHEQATREKAWQEYHAQATAKLIQMARTEIFAPKQ